MNGRICRTAILLAAGLVASMSASAATRPGVLALQNHLTRTCKNMNPANIFREPDGGYHESAQGWFSGAAVHQSSSGASALAYCYYGLDNAAPANRPVYSIHYELTGFKSNQCTVAGPTITCDLPPLTLKQ
jgi:hypothetical protein